jgi:hypothetical protein
MPGAGPRCHGACLNWPPPMRNLTPTLPQRPPPLERPLTQVSDFSREFYAAGTTPPSTTTTGHRQSPPYQPRYAPPPGPPLPPRRPRATSTSSGAGSTAPPTSDGHPTTRPTPGHPLLRSGQTLSKMCVTCLILLCSPIHLPARRPCPTRTHPTSRPQQEL